MHRFAPDAFKDDYARLGSSVVGEEAEVIDPKREKRRAARRADVINLRHPSK